MVDTWYRYIYFLTENPNTQYLLICGVLQHKKFRFRYQYWEKFADITGSDQFHFIIQSWTCWIIVCEKIRTFFPDKKVIYFQYEPHRLSPFYSRLRRYQSVQTWTEKSLDLTFFHKFNTKTQTLNIGLCSKAKYK